MVRDSGWPPGNKPRSCSVLVLDMASRKFRKRARKVPLFLILPVAFLVFLGITILLPFLLVGAVTLGLVALVAVPVLVFSRLEEADKRRMAQASTVDAEAVLVEEPAASPVAARPERITEIEAVWGAARGEAMVTGLDGAVDEMWPVVARCIRRLEDDPARLATYGHTLLVLVEGLRDSLRDYNRLASYSDSLAAASRERLVEQTLPRLREGLERFSHRLLLDDVMQLEASLQTLEDTLVLEGIAEGRRKSLVA